jgi:hypothetical protein
MNSKSSKGFDISLKAAAKNFFMFSQFSFLWESEREVGKAFQESSAGGRQNSPPANIISFSPRVSMRAELSLNFTSRQFLPSLDLRD